MKMIFHHPMPILPDADANSGSQVRPGAMLKAFSNIGAMVSVVAGFGAERSRCIARIQGGTDYELLYAESLSTPTMLSEPSHLPLYPFLDERFFARMQRRGCKIGVFYRDIYWRAGHIPKHIHLAKRLIVQFGYRFFYAHELHMYRELVDRLYVPSRRFAERYLPEWPTDKIEALPPGCRVAHGIERTEYDGGDEGGNSLRMLYIGGVTPPLYDISPLLALAKIMNEFCTLQIVCRAAEWKCAVGSYAIPTQGFSVASAHGSGLEGYFQNADVFAMTFTQDQYRDVAVPVKLFDAIGHGVPVVSLSGNAAADFLRDAGCGWVVDSQTELCELVRHLSRNPAEVARMRLKTIEVARANVWETRAQKVIDSLLRKG